MVKKTSDRGNKILCFVNQQTITVQHIMVTVKRCNISLAGMATSTIFVANTSFVATKVCLLQQNYVLSRKKFCRNENDTCGSSCQW